MKTPIKIILLILSFTLNSILFAQVRRLGGNQDDFETQRVNIYTNVLNLTPDEAKKFWPIFNQFNDEREQLQKDKRKLTRSYIQGSMNMSDAEIEKTLQDMFNIEQKILDNRKKYFMESKRALPMKKIPLLQKADILFKKSLIQDFRSKRQPMNAPGNGGVDEF